MTASSNIDDLTDKEKDTLRLVLRGHDAKSMARALGLSVHTVNDRLRAARRKLGVTSSKEAARLLDADEKPGPKLLADKDLGSAPGVPGAENVPAPNAHHPDRRGPGRKSGRVAGAILMLTIAIAAAALAASGILADHPASPEPVAAADTQTDAALQSAARDWLALVDSFDWQASFDAAGRAFREPNTVGTWREASELARIPLGEVRSRTAIGTQFLNAPPSGYYVARFRTDFSNRDGVTEHVTLEREEGAWKVVGYFIT